MTHAILGTSVLAPFRPGHSYVPALDEAAGLGFNLVRVFCGPLPWCNQTREAVYAGLPGFLQHCADRGLNAYLSYCTEAGTGYDLGAHVSQVEDTARAFPAVVLREVANEPWHPTQGGRITPLACWELSARMTGPPAAYGAPEDDESDKYAAGDFVPVHLDRGRDKWNQVRRVRECLALSESTGKPVLNQEPIGADEQSVAGKRESDPAFYYTLGALNRLFLGGSGVFHSQSGLMAERLGPRQLECAKAYLAGVRLWPGADRLTYKNAGHDGSPVRGARFNDGDMGKEGCTRAYSGLQGGVGFSVVLGVVGNSGVDWACQHERIGGMAGVEIYRVAR